MDLCIVQHKDAVWQGEGIHAWYLTNIQYQSECEQKGNETTCNLPVCVLHRTQNQIGQHIPPELRCGTLKCWKLKNYFFYSFPLFFLYFSFFFPIFLSFLILQARNQHIWLEKRTLRLNLPYGHLGWQPLKPLGSEVTHPPCPPSVHITNHHYHLHITLFYTTQYILHTQQTPNTFNHMEMHNACGLMQAKIVDFPRSDLV